MRRARWFVAAALIIGVTVVIVLQREGSEPPAGSRVEGGELVADPGGIFRTGLPAVEGLHAMELHSTPSRRMIGP